MKSYNTLISLNAEQTAAVLETEGPQLILAGAGSGKTRTITHKIAYLCEKGISPSRILAITFTNKAANEMKERIKKLVGTSSNRILATTFHSFCNKIVKRDHSYVGLTKNYTIYDQKDQNKLIKNIISNDDDFTIDFKDVINYIQKSKNKMIEPSIALIEATDVVSDQLATIYKEYNTNLRKNNALDFDDLLLLALKIMDNKELAEYWKSKYRYVFVDEFQDTNLPQFKLVQTLTSKYNNICVVGDDNQAIYGWRGSEIKYILDFNHWFDNTKLFKLETNYRSTPIILKAASDVIDLNLIKTSKEIIPFKKDNEHKVYILETDNEYAEAFKVIQRIKTLLIKREPKDIAILYRTNMQSRVFEEECIINNIPYHIVKGTNFYARKEVKDIIAFIKFINNPDDSLALERIINFPPRKLGKTIIDKVKNQAKLNKITLWEAVQANKTNIYLETFIKNIKRLQQIDKINDLTKEIINTFDIIEYWKKQQRDINDSRLDNIFEFIATSERFYIEKKENTRTDFLDFIGLMCADDPDNKNSVTLMTAHASKGLEFPVVFVTGVAEGLFPLPSYSSKEMEEERRLFYVALTRAKDIGHISYSSKRMVYGKEQYYGKSHFIDAINDNYLTNKELN